MNPINKLLPSIKAFLETSQALKDVRNEIALHLCPIKIGERVSYKTNGKFWEGVVDDIHYSSLEIDLGEPHLDEEPGWSVEGLKINKGSGKVGKNRFSFCMHESELINGIWDTSAKSPDRWNRALKS